MGQISAVTEKMLKEFVRDKTVLLWTFAVPAFFLLIIPFINTGSIPEEVMPGLKAFATIAMITLLMMTACQANLAGSVASDTQRGLYLKMASMPLKAWKEGIGRFFGILIFSLLGAILIAFLGLAYGARFGFNPINLLQSSCFLLLISLASAGIGFIIASLVKGESAATHTGVALTLLTFFCGGMTVPYATLPSALQAFARLHPISSANAIIAFLLIGEAYAGYNPLSISQIELTIAFSIAIFAVGLAFYTRCCWRKR